MALYPLKYIVGPYTVSKKKKKYPLNYIVGPYTVSKKKKKHTLVYRHIKNPTIHVQR